MKILSVSYLHDDVAGFSRNSHKIMVDHHYTDFSYSKSYNRSYNKSYSNDSTWTDWCTGSIQLANNNQSRWSLTITNDVLLQPGFSRDSHKILAWHIKIPLIFATFLHACSEGFVNLYSAHMDPKVWLDPEQFKPDRFLDEDGKFVGGERVIPFSLGKADSSPYELCWLKWNTALNVVWGKFKEIVERRFIRLKHWVYVLKILLLTLNSPYFCIYDISSSMFVSINEVKKLKGAPSRQSVGLCPRIVR